MAEKYLEEAKMQFRLISDANDAIKMRAVRMMSFIGVTMAAAAGFRLTRTVDPGQGIYVEIVAMCAMVGAMILYLFIIKTEDMEVVIGADKLLDESDSGYRLNKNCCGWINLEPKIYYPRMLKEYLLCIKHGEEINKRIAARFNWSTYMFVAGVSLYVIWTLQAVGRSVG